MTRRVDDVHVGASTNRAHNTRTGDAVAAPHPLPLQERPTYSSKLLDDQPHALRLNSAPRSEREHATIDSHRRDGCHHSNAQDLPEPLSPRRH
jgi:hypothetical protein